MKRAIIRNNLLLLIGAFILFFIVVFFSLYWFEKKHQESFMLYLIEEVELAYTHYDGSDDLFIDDYGYDGRRITILDEHAIVIADSYHNQLGYDESDQYEIIHLGSISSRVSEHVNEELIYIATQLDSGIYIRIAIEQEAQTQIYSVVIWILFIGAVLVGGIYYLGLRQVNKNLLKPWEQVKNGLLALNQGKYQVISLTSPYPEINDILFEMNTINEQTSKHLSQIEAYHHQLDRILNHLQQAVLLFNHEEKMTYYNHDAQMLFDLNEDDLNTPSYAFIRDQKLKQAIHDTNINSKHQTFDLAMNASIYETNTLLLQAKEEFGNQSRVLVILKDVTSQRQLEAVKRDFISHASHELKSPLTVIKGNAELIEHDMLHTQEDIKHSANHINKQAIQMTALVEDMLMLSRLEHLNEIPNTTHHLSHLLVEVLDQLKPLADRKHITFEVKKEDVLFVCDRLDMYKLFKNLIENAINYSLPHKKITIVLSQKEETIIFVVDDQGVGIPKEHQQRVFERFYRIDKGRIDKGTGLGLAIVKHVTLKYHGHIDLKSTLNSGTKITIFLQKNLS